MSSLLSTLEAYVRLDQVPRLQHLIDQTFNSQTPYLHDRAIVFHGFGSNGKTTIADEIVRIYPGQAVYAPSPKNWQIDDPRFEGVRLIILTDDNLPNCSSIIKPLLRDTISVRPLFEPARTIRRTWNILWIIPEVTSLLKHCDFY